MNSVLEKIDNFLNSITMYRLVLNGLLILVAISITLGFLGFISFGGFSLFLSALLLCMFCYGTNYIISKIYNAPYNVESSAITALILFFLIEPSLSIVGVLSMVCVSVCAMVSKYIIAIHKKHIFNPAAISVFVATYIFGGVAIWWVGTPWLTPFVLILGLLIVRKTRRFSLFFSFVIPAILVSVGFSISHGFDMLHSLGELVLSGPLIFLATIMLTEPSTTPPTRFLQMVYGVLVGVLFGSQFDIALGSIFIYSTPHFALIVGNIFSYIVSSKEKYFLQLKERNTIALDTYEFVFTQPSSKKYTFVAGQYAEWTLPFHGPVDSRGNRRFFTFASSPTDTDIRLATKITQTSSSFKKSLLSLVPGSMIVAGNISGDFTLPHESLKKIVWIAGGIGITPFVSKTQYIIDTKQKRDAVLFYSSATVDGFAYIDLFKKGSHEFGLKTVYVVAGAKDIPENWTGKTGFITKEMIVSEVPDYTERIFYISGPNAMVNSYKKILQGMNIASKNIVTDYFPGF